uniref:SCP domain-containing protein n=1 Tax=Macrostomum lignano TaxID=282301 RepID=A0A1I8FIH1_9PLAT
MASSMTSIFILAVIALVAIKMCKASESNALIISRLVSQDASVSSVDADSTVLNLRRDQFVNYCIHLGGACNNRTDSGVYEDPQEPPAGDPSETPPPPPPPPRPLQSRQSEDIQRMPQSKSYSRKAAAKDWLNPQAKLHSTSSTTNRNFKMSDSIRPREICSGPRCGFTVKMYTNLSIENMLAVANRHSEI